MDNSSPYYSDESIRNKIDILLKENAKIECSLGKDSTIKERIRAKVKQDRIFNEIKKLDVEFYKILIPEDERS